MLTQIPQESKLGVTPQLTKKTTVNFQTKDKGNIRIAGCDILPDGKLLFIDVEGKRLLMFSNNGNYEKDIVRSIHVEIGSPTSIANIYRVCNGVCNDVYKYDLIVVPNCNNYNVFSCV
jgi:hypothetical protein